MQPQINSIIAELEDAVCSGTTARRVVTLRRITDLFLHDQERLSDEQVRVFDNVLSVLVERVEGRARREISRQIAFIDNAPSAVIQILALDEDISIAKNILGYSTQVTTKTLVQVANTRSQEHLFAMSSRENLPETVTDVLVKRGESRVVNQLAANSTAQFSEGGYAGMVARAEGDEQLTELLGLRLDLPVKLLRDLLQ